MKERKSANFGKLYTGSRKTKPEKLLYLKRYRDDPDYDIQRQAWLDKHPNYYRNYRRKKTNRLTRDQRRWLKENRERRKHYMKEYMQRYRTQKRCKQ